MKKLHAKQNTDDLDLVNFNRIIYQLYDNKNYLEIIRLYNIHFNSKNFYEKCFFNFNIVVNIVLLVTNSYCCIGNYAKALEHMIILDDSYYIYKRTYFLLMQILRTKDFKKINKEDAQAIVQNFNENLRIFNKDFRLRFYNNLAYIHYKRGTYKEAIEYYKKAIPYAPDNIQLLIGYYQAVYYGGNKTHCINGEIKKELINNIDKIMQQQASFDLYLALGKLHYFIGEYQQAFTFVNLALDTLSESEKNKKEIYAYDWISRISYKLKQYATASIFYEKIIDSLIKSSENAIIEQETIHPKPELYKMLKFLNETKQYIASEETSKLSKSIWAGIIITTIFGLIECFKNYEFSTETCIFLGLGIFIITYAVLHCEIRFTNFLNIHFPTYSKWIKFIFAKVI